MYEIKSFSEISSDNRDSSYVALCPDGKYRWSYELNMYKNPVIFLTVIKVLLFSFLVVALFVAAIQFISGDWKYTSFRAEELIPVCILFAVFFVITVISYLLVAKQNGGKYIVLFEMDEEKITHRQMPQQFSKAQANAWIVAAVGAMTNNPHLLGAGTLSVSRDSLTSYYSDVRRVSPKRMYNTIKLNGLFKHNQIYVRNSDFDFVLSYVMEHVEKSAK